jgi:hypothetical protein
VLPTRDREQLFLSCSLRQLLHLRPGTSMGAGWVPQAHPARSPELRIKRGFDGDDLTGYQ